MQVVELKQSLLPWLRARCDAAAMDFAEEPALRTDGFETEVFFVEFARAPRELEGPLVLRLYRGHDEPNRARVEATLQGAVAGLGYPAPKPRLVVEDTEPLGAAFQLMDRLPGKGLGVRPSELVINAEAALQLHALPAGPVEAALLGIGERREDYRFPARLDLLRRDIESGGVSGLRPAHDWLVANRPVLDPAREVICHGDMMMNNVLRDGRRLSGVVDWSAHRFQFAERELEVATAAATWLGFRAPIPSLLSKGLGLLLGWVSEHFIRAYARHTPLDRSRLRYYGLWRCASILANVTTAARGAPGRMRVDNADNFLTAPEVIAGFTDFFREQTGVRLDV